MKLKITDWGSVSIRYKIAEIIAIKKLKAIHTSRYPPKILHEEFFDNMNSQHKKFLEKYWTTFDLFKPKFEIIDEIPVYGGFELYEVKSKLITEKNLDQLEKPRFIFTLNQKKFFDECIKNGISTKIFGVFFLEDWIVEYKEFDYKYVDKKIKIGSYWNEERMKRIKSSKLSQFFNELYPEYVLYKVDEERLNKKDENIVNEYIKEMVTDSINENREEPLKVAEGKHLNKHIYSSKIEKEKKEKSKKLKEKRYRCKSCGRKISHRGYCLSCNYKRKYGKNIL